MFRKIFKAREETPRPRHGFSEPLHGFSQPRPPRKIPQQFLQQVNEDEFEMVLVQPKPRPAKKAVSAPPDPLRFVFHPRAASTPRRKAKVAEPPRIPACELASAANSQFTEPAPSQAENHRLGPRLTMSQFIGTLPDKPKEHEQSITIEDVDEEIAVKLPNYLREDSHDFETIMVDDFTDGESCEPKFDLNKTQDLLKLILGEDYQSISTLPLEELDVTNLLARNTNKEEAFAPINDSTRCIFREILRDTNPRKAPRTKRRDFEIPPPRELFRSTQRERRKKKTIPEFLSQQLRPQRKQRKVVDGMQFRRELRELYEFLKFLFDDNEGENFL